MKRVGLGGFSAVCRAAEARRDVTPGDPSAPVGVKRRVLLELQWQGRGGRFRHVVVSRPGLRRALGAVGIAALSALAVVAATSSRSPRAPAPLDVDTLVRENMVLTDQRDALRERAFDLAERLYVRVEQESNMLWSADPPARPLDGPCPRPPAQDAETEALLAWLSEQSARLEALGGEVPADRVEVGVRRASVPATGGGGTVAPSHAAVLLVADMGSAGQHEAAPARH